MDAPLGLDVDSLLLIVVGAHLRAEIHDRPLANRLCERIAKLQESSRFTDGAEKSSSNGSLKPVVCSDIWFLNNADLMERPAIAIGEPGVNAATAFLANRLPTALVVDHSLRIHLDPDFVEAKACLWGVNPDSTAAAIDVFVERYLPSFLAEACE